MSSLCPAKPAYYDEASPVPYTGNTIHHTLQDVAIACTVTTGILAFSLILTHLLRYRVPMEQRQIIRLISVPFVYVLISFLEITFYDAADYLRPLTDLYEAFVLAALLILFVQFTESALAVPIQAGKQQRKRYSPRTVKIVWVLVFQYPLIRLICTIAIEATLGSGRFCTTSSAASFANLWITIIQNVSAVLAIGAIIRFYIVAKSNMSGHNALLKLGLFKLLVILSILQRLIFNVLTARGALKGSTYVSYNDITIGIPAILSCIEGTLISALNWIAFQSREYSIARLSGINHRIPAVEEIGKPEGGHGQVDIGNPQPQKLSFFKAVLSSLNPWDLLQGLGHIFTILLSPILPRDR